MDPEIGWESLEWINVAQDTDRWRVVDRKAMKRQVFLIWIMYWFFHFVR
jgi:hypothetical protein